MVTLKQIKIKEEDYNRILKKKSIQYEPIHHTISVLLDKADIFDKRVKR